jgi:6-phosphogluconolactonase
VIKHDQYASLDDAAEALATALSDVLEKGIDARGYASIAVSGGRTPSKVFPHLLRQDVDWARVHLTLTDERWVEVDHPDSNEGMVRRHLLDHTPKAHFLGLKTKAATPAEGLDACIARFESFPFPLDGVFLGMGEDGHTASLFADDTEALSEAQRFIAAPFAKERGHRISMGLGTLLSSRTLFLVCNGAAKKKAYDAAHGSSHATKTALCQLLKQDEVPVRVFFSP